MGFYMHSEGTANPIPGGIPIGTLERIEADIAELRSLRATLEQYGMGMISESSAVTETDFGLVLSAKEKNAAIEGTLANSIEEMNKELQRLSGIDTVDFGLSPYQSAKVNEEKSAFFQILFMQGGMASASGCYILSGYGVGENRYFARDLSKDGAANTVTIEGQSFLVQNSSNSYLNCRIVTFMGEIPQISF